MRKFLKEYKNPNESRINFGLLNRTNDDALEHHIIRSFKSLEILKNIKLLGYEHITDPKDIDLNDYIVTRKSKDKSKKKSKQQEVSYMHMKDSRESELRLKFKLSCHGESKIIEKRILIPVTDEDGYLHISGQKYFLLFQLVDSSTYTNKQNLITKSSMPISIKRTVQEFKDTTGEMHKAPTYSIYMFNKEIEILLFYFAKMGVKKTLKYFAVNKIIKFVNEERDTENCLYFAINSKILIEVNKTFFFKYTYVRSMVFMIINKNVMTNRLNIDNLEDKSYWIEKIGSSISTTQTNFLEKGYNRLTFFDRMLDESTIDILKTHKSNKKNIYAVVRWMIQNYNELRKKDNMDLANKRLRCNEYIAAMLTRELSKRINSVIALGSDVTMDKLENIFKFPGTIIFQRLYKSGLLKFDDRINDMDFFTKFRYTIKGPNALGSNNSNNINNKYRGLHPSFLGRLDINVCSTSDPGSTGVITPFCKTSGLFFDDKYEPEDGVFEMEKEIIDMQDSSVDSNTLNINLEKHCNTADELYRLRESLDDTSSMITGRKKIYCDPNITYININVEEEEEI